MFKKMLNSSRSVKYFAVDVGTWFKLVGFVSFFGRPKGMLTNIFIPAEGVFKMPCTSSSSSSLSHYLSFSSCSSCPCSLSMCLVSCSCSCSYFSSSSSSSS